MYISRGVSFNFLKNIVFFSLKIFFTFTNSVDSDKMRHYAGSSLLAKVFHQGFPEYKGLTKCIQ